MTEIYLIRHVQAEGNLFRAMQGWWDGEATALGLRQADALSERFRGLNVDAVYSSDLSRAMLTAGAVGKGRNLPLHTDARLREIDMGPWETCFFGDLRHEQPEALNAFLTDALHWQMDGAETYAAVTARVWPALEEIVRANEGKTVAVVSHGITIRCLLSRALGLDLTDHARLPLGGNTAVSRLLYQDDVYTADYINDSSHLTAEAFPPRPRLAELRAERLDPMAEPDWYTACYADAWQAAHGTLRGFEPESYLLSAARHHREDPDAVLKLYAGEDPVALVDMDLRRGAHAGYGWLSLLYIRPEYRRQGYGIQALGRAILRYKRLGRRALRLTVAEDNRAALAFYRHWGFETLSCETGSFGKLLLMEKKLGGAGYV